MRKKVTLKKLNNRGAALVLVLVVIAFVSITATILLYMSAMNFYMKTTDTKTKASFYSGEKALEEIKASMMVDATKAFEKAYYQVMVQYGAKDAKSMQEELNKEFIMEFKKIWRTHCGSVGDFPSSAQLQTYLNSSAVVDSAYSGSIKVGSGTTGAHSVSEGTITIKNISVEYTDSNNYTTMISTDILVKVPKIRFDAGSSATEDIELVDCINYLNWVKK